MKYTQLRLCKFYLNFRFFESIFITGAYLESKSMKAVRWVCSILVLCMLVVSAPVPADAHRHGGWGHWGWYAPLPFLYLGAYSAYSYPYPYYYPAPYYGPSTVVVQGVAPTQPVAPPQQQFWYYCESAKAYYPYIPSCQEGWKMVPITPTPPR